MKKLHGKKIILIPLLVIAGIGLFGYITMLLWNALMPELFHLAELNYWQALGLLVLSKLLFGGFHGKNGGHGHHCRSHKEHFENLSEEEKEKLKTDWRRFCNSKTE